MRTRVWSVVCYSPEETIKKYPILANYGFKADKVDCIATINVSSLPKLVQLIKDINCEVIIDTYGTILIHDGYCEG